ncbi:hypothetical protein H1R20_g5241, partial [Candolleomyces eurysporus]
MTISSDNVAHRVTTVKLPLDATMECVSVPKRDAKVHLKAVVKNASEYTLLRGPASVPEETFDCPLGTRNYVFSQRVTLHNTKSLAIDNLTTVDQIPVSKESSITVKLVSSALPARPIGY